MTDFRLGEHVLVTTPGRDSLAEIRKQYLAQASEFCAAFRTDFATLADSDVVLDRFTTVLDRAFDETVAAVAEDVAKERIYHWDTASLRRELEARATAFRQDYDGLGERYASIIAGGQEREAIRAANSENGPSIIGGGFGVKGAAEGIAIATAANAVIGVVQGAASAVAKAAATKADRQQKEELFRAAETLGVLTGLLHSIVLEGHSLVADIVNRENPEPRYDIISTEASQRASALTENIEAGRVPVCDIAPLLIQSLQLDPFRETPWRLWLEHQGDVDGGVGRAAEALGVAGNLVLKNHLLNRRRAALAWSTPEDCRSNVALLNETARFLGLPFDEDRRQIEARANELDLERRTFMGSTYDTVEEVNEARRAADDLARRTEGGVVYPSAEEAEAVRASRASKLARERRYRSTSIFMWLAILIVPLPAALFTLAPGFRPWQRVTALLWMALIVVDRFLSSDLVLWASIGTVLTAIALVLMTIEIETRKWLSHV